MCCRLPSCTAGPWPGADSPVHQQVLLHAEALGAAVAVEAVVGPAQLGLVLAVALALRQLRQLVLSGAEGPRLLPHARRVDHQAVLLTQTIGVRALHRNM